MSLDSLRFQTVDFAYADSAQTIFQDLTLHFSLGWTGVVGPNGAGKSTLLRLACGLLRPVSGKVERPALAVYCPQRTDHPPAGLEALMSARDRDAMLLKARLEIVPEWPELWPSLSHGERKRLQIGAALYQNPDLLAVDEPGNHLDLAGRGALMEALSGFRGLGLLVGHDRDMLDRLCEATLFLEPPRAVLRPGAYSLARREARREKAEMESRREKAEQRVAHLESAWQSRRREAARSGARRSKKNLARKDSDGRARINLAVVSGQDAARGRLQRQLSGRLQQARDHLSALGHDKEHPEGIVVTGEVFRGDRLLALPAGQLELGPGKRLIHPELLLRPGDRVALGGRNGCGKSSLIEALLAAASLPPGRLLYLPQELSAPDSQAALDQARLLKGEQLGWVMNLVSRLGSRPERLLQSRLPSPGETRKLLLALGLLARPWLLVLDEPTNHLDLRSLECLEQALRDTRAALLLVSHDRHFLRALTNCNWAIDSGQAEHRLRIE